MNNIVLPHEHGIKSTLKVKGSDTSIWTRFEDDYWVMDIESEPEDAFFNFYSDGYTAIRTHLKLVDLLHGGQSLSTALKSIKWIKEYMTDAG